MVAAGRRRRGSPRLVGAPTRRRLLPASPSSRCLRFSTPPSLAGDDRRPLPPLLPARALPAAAMLSPPDPCAAAGPPRLRRRSWEYARRLGARRQGYCEGHHGVPSPVITSSRRRQRRRSGHSRTPSQRTQATRAVFESLGALLHEGDLRLRIGDEGDRSNCSAVKR